MPAREIVKVLFLRPRRFVVALVAALSIAGVSLAARAQESYPVEGEMDLSFGPSAGPIGAGCGCKSVQQPPWHGNVGAPAQMQHQMVPSMHGHAPCGPSSTAHHGCFHPLPPFFPRMHALCREGMLLTPPPLAMPRCHNCGAHIEGGF